LLVLLLLPVPVSLLLLLPAAADVVLLGLHPLQLQPATCSERISAVRIDQIGLLGQMYHHAV
jgi:hypothetical protein